MLSTNIVNMQIHYNPQNIENNQVIALGNFDGVHLGHKAILKKTKYLAGLQGFAPAVITFEPHPVHLFKPQNLPIRITSLKGKLQLLEKMGIENCYILKFNRKFAGFSAEEFISKYLSGNHIVTGYDFVFGKGRSGNAQMLQEKLGKNYTMITPQAGNGVVYSSSKVRAALKIGDMQTANFLLGHNYFIEGRVLHGAGKGAEIGFPTANIKLKPYLLKPKYGVYKVSTNFGAGIANFGVRPTIDGITEVFEVHLFDFKGGVYGKMLNVELERYIREEKKFSSIQELKNQIQEDIKKARDEK